MKPRESVSILIVEDEEVVLEAARRILALEGFRVIPTCSAEEAARVLDEEVTDVALVDLMLPGQSGIDFIGDLKRDYPSVVAIATTGYANVDHTVSSLSAGAFDFLPKPFTFEELLGPVYRAIRFRADPYFAVSGTSIDKRTGYMYLGIQAWMHAREPDAARLGVTDVFVQSAETIVSVDMPERGGMVQQGGWLATFHSEDRRSHVAWSPLSGRVNKVNREAAMDPDVIMKYPFEDGWIASVSPFSLEEECTRLREGNH
jgi:DNA-binding response OmpR family regulator